MRQIPLSRAIAAVPTIGTLCIEAALRGYDGTAEGECEDIVNGSVNFKPVEEETQVQIIEGNRGRSWFRFIGICELPATRCARASVPILPCTCRMIPSFFVCSTVFFIPSCVAS